MKHKKYVEFLSPSTSWRPIPVSIKYLLEYLFSIGKYYHNHLQSATPKRNLNIFALWNYSHNLKQQKSRPSWTT